MHIKELRGKNKEELMELMKENRNNLRAFRFQVGQGKVKNNKQGREIKKTIARIITLMKGK